MPISVLSQSTGQGPTSGERPSLRERWIWIAPDQNEFELTNFVKGTEVVKGMSGRGAPPARFTRDQVPGRAGQRTRSVTHGPREMTVPLLADGGDFHGLHELLETLVEYMDPAAGEGILRRIGRDGTQNDLFCRLASGLGINGEGSSGPAFFRPLLVFQADDPYWYGPVQTKGFTGGEPTSWFPILLLQLGSSSVIGTSSIANDSTIDTYPIWTIKGPGAGPTITNTTTGKTFTLEFDAPLGVNDVVVVDTREYVKSVTGPDGSNWRRYLTQRSLWPLVGGENLISLSMADTTEASYISVSWRERKLYAR